ncbi:concanavalin A-like lectin/glucanase [Cubamyces sp. BRFM 1775]|nr:concanavalin A-like lectin/glucanase [Cubamyces sp. BRFM 1775]
MLFSSLFFHVFVATAVLAVPTTGEQGAHQAAGTDRAQPAQVAPVATVATVPAASAIEQDVNTDDWAGVALTFGSGSVVESVTGTFAVPVPNAPPGGDDHEVYESAAWLGIDGYTCPSALLRTGVVFIRANGVVTANAWYEWFPNIPRTYYDITVAPGDVITATVTAETPQSAVVSIINNSTGQQASVTLGGAEYASLCLESGEWIVGDPSKPNGEGGLLPLPDFGTVTFSGAFASVEYTPGTNPTTNILNIVQNQAPLTSVTTKSDIVTVEYIGK